MAYGQRDPDALTNRNSDRVRILKFLARHPEGISQTALCHYVLKGVAPSDYSGLYDLSGDAFERHDEGAQHFYNGSDWVALDGSDDDYQFLNRFVNDLEAEFNTDEGFVSWYRYGNHDHSEPWVEDRVRFHQEKGQIDFDGSGDNPMQKTAGSYIGKYLSETYALLLDLDSLDDPDFQGSIESPGKSAWWKLAMYWCTQRRFWSPSRTIRRDIELDSDRSDIRRGVADATRTSLLHHTGRFEEGHALYPDLDCDRADSLLYRLVRDLVAERELEATEASTSSTTLAQIEYLGAYHYGDLPSAPDRRVRSEALEAAINDPDEPVVLASTGDRPPPVTDAW